MHNKFNVYTYSIVKRSANKCCWVLLFVLTTFHGILPEISVSDVYWDKNFGIVKICNEYLTHWMPFVWHTTMQQHFIDMSINITTITESESTTGKNYPNVNILLLNLAENSLRGGRVGKLLHCPARKKNWITWPSVKLTSWLVPKCPIQCERTSFPASFTRSAGRKNILRGQVKQFCTSRNYSVHCKDFRVLEKSYRSKWNFLHFHRKTLKFHWIPFALLYTIYIYIFSLHY